MSTAVSPAQDAGPLAGSSVPGPQETVGPVSPRPARRRSVLRGRAEDPVWVRPSLLGLLTGTGVLYLWDLAASGWANAFYAAAVQAGTQSWEAFFFGSSDAANSITVDKPPASLWVMEISARIFGLNSWSLLVPEALMGVGTVGVVYLAVRRVAGPGPGLLAGAAMALTPVAVLMFQFDNPDALLVLLLALAGYATMRATETASLRWLLGVGVLIGFAFLTKTLQAVLVVPGFAAVYLLCAPTSLRIRIGHLLAAGLAMVVAGGWWVVVVELVPASARPYIGGSQTNSVWELIWGYNGLGRLTGDETGSVGTGGGPGSWGATGPLRLFDSEIGGQVSWLLPAALLLLVGGLLAVGRAGRTDPRWVALGVWGSWLLVTGLTFSYMAGIFHAYYTVALAPAIAAVAGIGGGLLWARRAIWWARFLLAGTLAVTVVWSAVLLEREAEPLPWLPGVLLVGGALAAAGLLLAHVRARAVRVAVLPVIVLGVLAALAGPASYAVATSGTPHTGSIPSAGPVAGGSSGLTPGRLFPRPAGGGTSTGTTNRGGTLLDASVPSAGVVQALQQNASSYTWVAATVGSNSASGYQLATGDPVMAIGGFNGSDPAPTLAEFQAEVAAGDVHWFIRSTTLRSRTGSDAGARITAWVQATFTARTVDGAMLYDLTPTTR